MTANSMSDVFRFVQLRPARTAVDVEAIPMNQTELTGALEEAGRRGRRRIATEALNNPELTISSLDATRFVGYRSAWITHARAKVALEEASTLTSPRELARLTLNP